MSDNARMRRRFAFLWVLVMAAAACAPDTDLTRIPASGIGSPALAVAGATLLDPAAGTADVPVNLAAVMVRFATPVAWGAQGLRICDVASGPPQLIACDGGVCYRAPLAAPLAAGASCQVAIGAGTSAAGGADLGGGALGSFNVAAGRDDVAPVLADATVDAAGPCAAVRFATDEPAMAMVVIAAAGSEVSRTLGWGQTTFDAAMTLVSLPPSIAATATITATDRAGNVTVAPGLEFQTPPVLPAVAITEVLANPAGPEPGQEYVELLNLGGEPVALAGLRIEDSKGGDDLPEGSLAGGGYALIVPSTYVPGQAGDPAPRAGTLLVRVDARIGSDGLSNGGEAIRLIQGQTPISSYGGWVAVSSSGWSGQAVHRLDPAACDDALAWNRTPMPPTPGAGL
jgi:hypothetical protein